MSLDVSSRETRFNRSHDRGGISVARRVWGALKAPRATANPIRPSGGRRESSSRQNARAPGVCAFKLISCDELIKTCESASSGNFGLHSVSPYCAPTLTATAHRTLSAAFPNRCAGCPVSTLPLFATETHRPPPPTSRGCSPTRAAGRRAPLVTPTSGGSPRWLRSSLAQRLGDASRRPRWRWARAALPSISTSSCAAQRSTTELCSRRATMYSGGWVTLR